MSANSTSVKRLSRRAAKGLGIEATKLANDMMHPDIRAFIIEDINLDCDSLRTLFTKTNSGGRDASETKNPFQEYSLLALYYRHAPRLRCRLLTDKLLALDKTTLVDLFSSQASTAKHNGHAIIEQAPREQQKRFIKFMKDLPAEELHRLLAIQGSDNLSHVTPVLADDEAACDYFDLIANLSCDDLISVFQSHTVLAILNKPISNRVAEALLVSLQNLEPDSLYKLFNGSMSSVIRIDENILHPIFKHYDVKVQQMAIKLLFKLDENQIESLLCDKKNVLLLAGAEADRLSPLGIVFNRKDNQPVNHLLIEKLAATTNLSRLLLNSSQADSPMRLAVKNGNIPAIRWYLEQRNLPEEEIVELKLLAQSLGQHPLVTLFQTKPLLDAILDENQDTVELEFRQLPEQYPDMLETRWSDEQTLLHKALAHGKTNWALWLLEAGVNPAATDSNGLTALQYKTQDIDIIKTIRHTLPYPHLLKIFSSLMSAPPASKQKPGAIKRLLKNTDGSLSIAQLLQQFCEGHQAGRYMSIMESARFTGDMADSEKQRMGHNFVETRLQTLASTLSARERNIARCDLLFYLFAMPFEQMLAFLNSMDLDNLPFEQLEFGLQTWLTTAAISSRLSQNEHQHLFAFFASKELYIDKHLCSPHLHYLPIRLLTEFAARTSSDKLLEFNAHNKSPSLLVVTLEKLLLDGTSDESAQQKLFSELEREFDLFNTDPSILSDDQLRHMLNLCKSPALVNKTGQYISNQAKDSPLVRRLQALFYKDSTTCEPQSALHVIFLQIACDKPDLNSAEYTHAMSAYLGQAQEQELMFILNKHHQAIEPMLRLSSLTPEGEEDVSQWLHSLDIAGKQHLAEDTEDAMKMDWLSSFRRESNALIELLTQSLADGILAHKTRNRLLPALCQWQLNYGHLCQIPILPLRIAEHITVCDPAEIEHMSQQCDIVLREAASLAPLLAKIKQLTQSESDIYPLIQTLAAENRRDLKKFVMLSERSKRFDLANLGRYVLAGQEPDSDFNLEQTPCFPAGTWLQTSLEAIEQYTAATFTFKAVIEGVYLDANSSVERLDKLTELLENHPDSLSDKAAIAIILSWQPVLSEDNETVEACKFVKLINTLFQTSGRHLREQILSRLPAPLIQNLLEHCLSGIASSDSFRQETCRQLLSCLSQHNNYHDENTVLIIKHRLSQQDVALLGNESLQALAQSVLAKHNDPIELTYNGIWIQRLLVSPQFVAASSPELIHRLVERYRALSLTLKQEEFRTLTDWLGKKMSFADQHNHGLQRLQAEMLADPLRKARLQAKRERLLAFRADDSITALFNQLEDECIEPDVNSKPYAEKALEVMYAYHSEHMTGMRTDILFRMANFTYAHAMRSKGDLAVSDSSLLQLLSRYVPHHSYQQDQLARKTKVTLYDENGQKTGFLDASNYALRIVDDEPVSLLQIPGIQPGTVFYDRHRQRLGTLTITGQMQNDNLFQRNTSALFLAKVPLENLQQSEAAINLLLQDVFNENTLDVMYTQSDSEEKRCWLQHQTSDHLTHIDKPVDTNLIQSIVETHSPELLMDMLQRCANQGNACNLAVAIFNDQQKRQSLFQPELAAAFRSALNPQLAQQMLSELLLQHYNKPWFPHVFSQFAQYANENDQTNLLTHSFLLVANKVTEGQIDMHEFDAILSSLLEHESTARMVLEGFLKDDGTQTIQATRTNAINHFTSLFGKHHMIRAIEQLNQKPLINGSAQYRLLLTIFNANHGKLFSATEFRLAENATWHTEDLRHATRFLIRHRQQGNTQDDNGKIGLRLLNELTFRTANFGQTDLFYQENGLLNRDLLTATLNRSTIANLLARFLPAKKLKATFKSLKEWILGHTDPEKEANLKLLREERAIIDWKQLINETWEKTDKNHLPVISAYLNNYTGSAKLLAKLLKDILSHPSFTDQREHWHHIAKVMSSCPQRDVSCVIFKTFEEMAAQRPEIMDRKILKHMALFHSKRHLGIETAQHSPQTAMNLLRHFGQLKHYELARFCCRLLPASVENQLLRQITRETKVENSLRPHVGRWYFSLLKTLKRWWNYSSGGHRVLSGLVTLCDKVSDYEDPKHWPKVVKSNEICGQGFTSALATIKERRALKARVDAFQLPWQNRKQNLEVIPVRSAAELGIFASNKRPEMSQPHIFEQLCTGTQVSAK